MRRPLSTPGVVQRDYPSSISAGRAFARRPCGYDPAAVDLREEQVVLETDRYRITGALTLPREGYRSRLSDHVNRRDVDFFTIQDAVVTPLAGGEAWTAPVLMLASRHIHLIVPADGG